MPLRKFTVILVPDEDGYQVFIPHFPSCTTWGKTPQEAFENAREAMELILEEPSVFDRDALELPSEYHVVVGDIEVEVPASLASEPEKVSVEVTA